ncbi:hypothetical protein SAMN02745216_02994 [Desulfatibacillum alkenivorans DSM 16219]|jgi:hypothetical protein|uniref:Uncharacterized protein n=1 Tax=Desulfatibacillum alkenivorans DSM 16219 TaxID=1121393 RepID=A0A1M6Q8M7_9BACT|nr:hypothetical protein SAMN02745216_02994 [Desulfatibacillum alkenivorans DSM 16219]
MPIDPKKVRTVLKISLEVLKTILSATDAPPSTHKQEREKSNAEDNHKNHKP